MGLTPDSNLWIGAWWFGYLVAAIFCILFAIPMLAFPRTLPGNFINFLYSIYMIMPIKVGNYELLVSTQRLKSLISLCVIGSKFGWLNRVY